MNIGSLVRGLLGDSRPGEMKTAELKEGQVVRGTVLSVSESGREAVVQIQGTPVRAELETPLTPGQVLALQVAPPGENGLPVLKPVPAETALLASPQSMGEALESLGLSQSKAGREIIQAILSAGLPLDKETAAKLDAVMGTKPQGVPDGEWLESAAISLKRGLPVTSESIKGIHQAVFGPKLHDLLANLENELRLWAEQSAKGSGAATPSASVPGSGGTAGMQASASAPSTLAASAAGVHGADAGPDVSAVRPGLTGAAAPAATGSAGEAAPAAQAAVGQTEAAEGLPQAGSGKAGLPGANPATLAGGSAAPGELQQTAAGKAETLSGNLQQAASGSADEAAANPQPAAGRSEAVAPQGKGLDGSQQGAAGRAEGSAGTQQGAAGRAEGSAGTQLGATGRAEGSAGTQQGAAGPAGTPQAAAGEGGTAGAGKPAPAAGQGLTSAAAPGGQAPADTPAAQPVPAGPAALQQRLQGVLAELRGTLPQLAEASPAAGAAGEATPPAPAAAAQGTAPTQEAEPWVGRVLKLLGAEHEQQAVRGGGEPAAQLRSAAAAAAAGTREAALPQAALQGTGAQAEAADTLKGVLLQVLGAADVPPAVKEAAGQLVQQLTGQQLLLNTDRTAPFAQVTMFLPLRGADGQETASVHIQSRRGRKGELDPANCRLWFDLDMRQLGQTLVDVQVVDRIVSLKLHNDTPWVLELLEARRDDIQGAIESIGYQLSGLRTEPLPERSVTASSGAAAPGKLADFVPDAYKGVDYRI
ncbi:DNA ligase [Paenibacillus tepidiphilus]|uniref:DNA ligase n=1 Tax=Paenibacillus tepidiphilus TaxID=2608683 RepID=UPI00123B4B35|nr:DNA ligase [Paenibacillus tepidiphilus]